MNTTSAMSKVLERLLHEIGVATQLCLLSLFLLLIVIKKIKGGIGFLLCTTCEISKWQGLFIAALARLMPCTPCMRTYLLLR